MYLRCMTGDRPRTWLQWLPWVEFCYNTSFHTALKTTPFKVVFGYDPPALRSYDTGAAHTQTVPYSKIEMSLLLMSGTVFSRPNKVTRNIMMSSTVKSPLMLISGSGSAYSTVQWHL